MPRNVNWMEDRLRCSPPRRFLPIRTAYLHHLPDEVLLRIIAAIMSSEHGLSDLYNLSLTSSRMRRLVWEAMAATSKTSVDMQGCTPKRLISTSPADFRHGVRMLLQSAKLDTLRLNHLPVHQLKHLLRLVDHWGSISELAFVDVAPQGVRISQQVAANIHTLAITMPKAATLLHLAAMGCKPKTLRLFCIDQPTLPALTEAWSRLTQNVQSAELLFLDDLYNGSYNSHMLYAVPHELIPNDSSMHWRRARPRSLCGDVMWTLRRDGSLSNDIDIDVIRLRDWLSMSVKNYAWPEPRFPPFSARGNPSSVVVVVDGVPEASAFLRRPEPHANRFGCMIRSEYIQCKSISIVGKFTTLHGNVEQQAITIARTMMLLAATSRKFTQITVDSTVASALADVGIPPQVRRIGIADKFATGRLLRKLPAILHNLTRDGLQRNVTLWMKRMPLRVDPTKRREIVMRAIRACRRATNAGLRGDTVRGALEDMLTEDWQLDRA
ncbi:hypothetical protein BWQ96_07346 [Gracilariopsis chorda]|uniref:F-box domain-containing protein n=1 Tax=Gracilariopsis chorda TaxID=448386 RepID=A0A2V3ILF8_9FLOR|nr:hypothetical protein BWQ96_07346 [Gracilariopsis chorda]|eukprot:PXF42899.1 hypothetical protein BWQ96_07346 [Gracilariopsis chorda]